MSESDILKDRIQEDVKSAMRAKDALRLGTLRMLSAAIKQREIDGQIALDNAGVIAVIEKMVKQRQEAFKQYESANRPELATKEKQEIDIISTYLPEPLSPKELEAAIDGAVQKTQAQSIKDMGKVMGLLKQELQGKVDMAILSQKIKERLS